MQEWDRHLEIFSLPQVIENSRQYLLLRTDILQKTVVGCRWDIRDLQLRGRERLRVRNLTSRFFAYSQNIDFRKASSYHILLGKLALLSVVKEVRRSPDGKMIKLLTFDILFSPARHSR